MLNFNTRSDFYRLKQVFFWFLRIDWWLILLLLILMGFSLLILHSSSADPSGRVVRQTLRFAAAWGLFFAILAIPPRQIRRITPWIYVLTVVLLALVPVMGISVNGAQRWLNLGVARLQPSEIAKLSVPLMVTWQLTQHARLPTLRQVMLALLIILIPVGLIAKQPDLGTAVMVAASGGFALFLAGISWKMMGVGALLIAIAAPLFWFFGIHDYQRERVYTLFHPEADPFGAGYHIIQSQIAIGSGGIWGKGYLHGTQAQLAFLPESSTDFIFAVIAEELGLVGITLLLAVYLVLIFRGLFLSACLDNRFARVFAGSVFLTFFMTIFVNVGMVSGFLPVVGMPLPLISYGGSSIISMMASFALAISLIRGYKARNQQEHL